MATVESVMNAGYGGLGSIGDMSYVESESD